ncbi:MAG: cation-translocating P-type ATPase [Bacillota bacterium]|nr:cation-translocating P-type ATPase [Bacillota bacterium]
MEKSPAERNPAWHSLDARTVAGTLVSDLDKGLSPEEALRRSKFFGPNKLVEQKPVSPWLIFCAQFKNFMVMVLFGATIISIALGEYADAFTILAIIFLNACLGFVQEYRAERALAALKQLSSPEATVVRNGLEARLPAGELVPGDLVKLEAGDRVPADLRLTQAISMEVEESILTGESQPVSKDATGVLPPQASLGDRRNMVFQGCLITKGRGQGLVVSTGMDTEMGKICGMLREVEEGPTPLQRRLERLGKFLVVICLALCALITGTGILRGEPVYQMFLAGVSLAVAAIPEGLPAIVTISLATGVQRLSKRSAIMRQLHAVETLGCTTVICSDKTGTLTQNEMTLQEIVFPDQKFFLSGTGYRPVGDFYDHRMQKIEVQDYSGLPLFLEVAALCNNAQLHRGEIPLPGFLRWGRKKTEQSWEIKGDPTEGALLVAAAKGGFWREALERKYGARLDEIPFTSERKMMSVIHRTRKGKLHIFVKGAPEVILARCRRALGKDREILVTSSLREKILQQGQEMAGRALRVLALAYREIPSENYDPVGVRAGEKEEVEENLVFIGLAGIKDPHRPAARRAVEVCRKAGIKVVMVTGDHPLTACAIGKELGLVKDERGIVLTGQELEEMNEDELMKNLDRIRIFARVSPVHKLRIVRAYKKAGEIVAMTGDGVNDAPALKEADVGIAMGRSGTDVTREAAAMILANDELNTIVGAIEEGRGIYESIRKFIRYLLACNIGEVLTMFFATLTGLPLPLLPIQILWVNLVTDGLPAIALGLDTPDTDLMKRPPRPPGEDIFARGLAKKILTWGFFIGLSSIFIFTYVLYDSGDLARARTAAFCCLVLAQLFHVFDCRSEQRSLFEIGILNLYILGAVGCSLLMQLAVIYFPVLQRVFHTVPLTGGEWLLILLAAGGATLGNGIIRWLYGIFRCRLVSFNLGLSRGK